MDSWGVWQLMCLSVLSQKDVEDVYIFGLMIAGTLLFGIGGALFYRLLKKTAGAVLAMEKRPSQCEGLVLAVGTLNRLVYELNCKVEAIENRRPPAASGTRQREAETTCSPPAVANSEPQSETPVHHVGVSVNVTCKQGFQLNGASLITCGANGQWQPQPPQCLHRLVKFQLLSIVAKDGCGAPPPPPVSHSNVHLSNKYITMTSFPSGAKVYYKCNAGYATEGGSRSRVCSDGKWTPLTLKCEAKSCGHPGQILNGQFEYSGGIVFGATATAVCDDGYTLVGRGIRRCTSNGWDGRVPVCEAVECEEPEKTDAERKTFQEPPYTYRSVIRYDCREKTLVGEREIWCTKDGTWSSSPPQCRDVTCPSPNIPNAFWVNAHRQTYRPRDTIDSFECRRGFKLSGSKFIICNDEGQWEPKLPSCQLQRQPQASSYRVRGWYNGRG